jgi:hypothetical protein
LQASENARNSAGINNKDILFEYINLHQLVQSFSLQEGKHFEIDALTVVVGNQSAGKVRASHKPQATSFNYSII